jgi:hypothetical protein
MSAGRLPIPIRCLAGAQPMSCQCHGDVRAMTTYIGSFAMEISQQLLSHINRLSTAATFKFVLDISSQDASKEVWDWGEEEQGQGC